VTRDTACAATLSGAAAVAARAVVTAAAADEQLTAQQRDACHDRTSTKFLRNAHLKTFLESSLITQIRVFAQRSGAARASGSCARAASSG
jgi:hypothetical protein